MADQDRPNQNATRSKDDPDNAGGISNRPLSDEIGNQETLPERGTTKKQAKRTNHETNEPE